MTGYELTLDARDDLDAIADYLLANAGTARATKVVTRFRSEFRKLAAMPGMGHYREDLLNRHYRFWSVYSYVVAYRWNADPIQIIAVVHGARDLEVFFRRRGARL